MFKFFAKRFVDDYQNYNKAKVRLNLISLSSIIGIFLNIILVVSKLIIGFIVNSTAIINDGVNNLADTIVSIMALVGSKVSQKPADKDHPHGHGRSEFIITLIISILIIYVGIKLFFNSLGQFKDSQITNYSIYAYLVMLLSIGIKFYMYRLNGNLARKLDSDLNQGVKLDSRNDILSTAAIIVGSFIGPYVSINVDAVLGIILAGFVIMSGKDLFTHAVNYLMGESLDPELEKIIGDIILDNVFIVGYHNLEIHEYGRDHMDGTVDVEIAENISLLAAHELITKIQRKIIKETGIRLSIHMNPTYTIIVDEEIAQKIKWLEEEAYKYEYDDF